MTRKLRIVHCFRSPVGGIFRHVRDLATAQEAAGHQIGIICDSSTGGAYEDALFDTIRDKLALGVHRTRMQRHIGPGDIMSAWRTYRLVKRLKPDILHGHGAKGGVYARLFGSLNRISGARAARLYSPHGGSLHYDETTLTGRVFFLLERLMGRFTDHILFVSDYERRTYNRKVGAPRAPASLVYNGLNPPEFEPVADAPDAVDFVYVGMMRDLKGPDIFIEALARVNAEARTEAKAVMIGDGDDLPRYRALAAELGLGDKVTFHPAMPARPAFSRGRVVVVPSRAEAMPYIVLETLAAGKPMIASAVGGIPEIFGADSPALITPDAPELAARMATVLDDPAAFAAAMPRRDELRQHFGADTMAARIEEIYFAALDAPRRFPAPEPESRTG